MLEQETLYMTEDLKEVLKRMAKLSNRTLSQQVCFMLTNVLKGGQERANGK